MLDREVFEIEALFTCLRCSAVTIDRLAEPPLCGDRLDAGNGNARGHVSLNGVLGGQ